MLKKAPNFVLTTHCMKPSNGYPSNLSTYRVPVALQDATGASRKGSSLPAVSLAGLFEHPEGQLFIDLPLSLI